MVAVYDLLLSRRCVTRPPGGTIGEGADRWNYNRKNLARYHMIQSLHTPRPLVRSEAGACASPARSMEEGGPWIPADGLDRGLSRPNLSTDSFRNDIQVTKKGAGARERPPDLGAKKDLKSRPLL